MKILELQASGFMRLEAVSIRPDGNLVVIEGNNGEGKTSVLEAVHVVLRGKAVAPPVPINKRSDKCVLRCDTGEYSVIRTFEKVEGAEYTTDLKITAADGRRVKRPQELLDSLLGDLSFDPGKFLEAKPRQQFDMLKKLVPADLEEIEMARSAAFEQRTEVNRRWKAAAARADGIKVPEGPKPKRIDVAKTMREIELIRAFNVTQMERRAACANAAAEIGLMQARAEELRRHLEQLEIRILEAEEHQSILPQPEAQKGITELQLKIEKAQQVDKIIASFEARDAAGAEAEGHRIMAEGLTKVIETCDQRKMEAISKASLPVEGLGLADGMVTYQGLPLEQAETAVQLRVAIAVAGALNPELRVIFLREGALIGKANMQAITEYAAANDLQIWVEKFCEEPSGNGIWITEGRIGQ